MHRNNLLNLLQKYKANERLHIDSENDIDLADKTIEFVLRNKDCFHRTLKEGHITASAVLLNRSKDKILLTLHKKFNEWLQLGGHADGDGDVLMVAIKEAKEESGILEIEPAYPEILDVDIHWVDTKFEEPHYHYDIRFLLKTVNSDQFIVSDESLDLRWFDKEDFKNSMINASVKKLFAKLKKLEI